MVYFPDIMYFQMIHMFFNPSPTNDIKFVKFPKNIHVAKQERFFGHFFPNIMINLHLLISNLLQDLIKIQSK